MILVLVTILLIVLIDYALGNKFSDAISERIEHICNKLYNKYSADVNQTSDDEKENKECYGKASPEYARLVDERLNTHPVSFNVPIPFDTVVNILEMVGFDKYRWIVDNIFELSIRGKKIDISNFCTIGATRTIVFFIGENNKFSLSVSFDSGEAIIKTNSKEFESEFAILTFGAKHINTPNKEYYGKATLELARMAQKKLEEESENNKIGDDNV